MINQARLINLLRQLVQTNSENPPGNEFRIARFVQSYFRSLGLKTKLYEFEKNRSNVIAYMPHPKGSRSLLISPHLDTVPAGASWRKGPFSAKIERGRLYGLGATDCKSNLACAMEAMRSLIEDKVSLGYELIFAATADEESGSGLGLIPLIEKKILRPDAAVVLDADDFDIIITQKGLMHLKVKIQGRRAHGAYPWLGINAIDLALDILRELKARKNPYPENKYLKPPTINIGTIRGGDKVNIVADWCEFELDFRFLPGMSAKKISQQLRQIVARRARKFKIEIEGIQDPYCIDENHFLVAQLKEAMRRCKMRPRIKGSEGATVITFFQHQNIPAVATGFGSGGCAHVADEYVKLGNLCKGLRMLEIFLKRFSFNR